MKLKSVLLLCVFPIVLEVLPGAAEEELDEAVWLATSGEYESAIALFEAALEKNPNDPLSNYFAGVSYFFLGNREEASRYLERAIESKAGFPQPYYWLAQVYAEEDEGERAVEMVVAGLKKFPKNEKLLKLFSKLTAKPEKKQ